ADDGRARPQQVRFVSAEIDVLRRRLDLEDDVGITPECARVADDVCSARAVVVAAERSSGSRTGFDGDIETEREQPFHRFRGCSDPPLARPPLPGNRNAQAYLSVRTG